MLNFHFDAVAGLLFVLIALGLISHNSAVTISACVLLIMQQTALATYLPWVSKYGLTIGIIILMFYNHQEGRKLKYLFYVYYPLHILVIIMIRDFLMIK